MKMATGQQLPLLTHCDGTAGRDVIGIAATGSGKTLAFGLPALAHTRAQLAEGVADGERRQRQPCSSSSSMRIHTNMFT